MLQLDLSINLTTIIGVIVWLITLAIAWTKFGGRIDMLELRVSHMEKALEKIAETLAAFQSNEKLLIVMNEQISSLQRQHTTLVETVEALRRGNGWISSNKRSSVDDEYP